MITRVLNNKGSTVPALDYNEGKVMRGVASVVMVSGIPDDDPYSIYSTMERYEDNPGVYCSTKNFCLHLAINPDVDDAIDEEGVKAYAKDLMEGIGFGGQPFVLYRHNDIEREHYHLVSVTVDERGKVIKDSYRALRLMKIQRALADKYNYTVGVDTDIRRPHLPEPKAMEKGSRNSVQQMRANIDAAIRASAGDPAAMTAAAAALGVKINRGVRKDNGRPYVSFTAIDKEGGVVRRPIGASKLLGTTFDEYVAEKAVGRERRDADGTFLGVTLAGDVQAAADLRDLERRFAIHGIYVALLKRDGTAARNPKDIAQAWVLDVRRGQVIEAQGCGIDPARLAALAAATYRKESSERKRRNKKKTEKKIKTTFNK